MERESRDFITEPKQMRFYRLAPKRLREKIEGPTEEAPGGHTLKSFSLPDLFLPCPSFEERSKIWQAP